MVLGGRVVVVVVVGWSVSRSVRGLRVAQSPLCQATADMETETDTP